MSEPSVEDYLDPALDEGDPAAGDEVASAPFTTASRQELAELVGALRRQLHQEADTLAEAALAEHLTPELYRALRASTTAGVLDALGIPPNAAAPAAGERNEPAAETYFRSLDEFVDQWLFTVYRREVTDSSDRRWCSQWRRHGEAVARLDAMWHVFEALRTEPALGASVLWKDHLDVHMEQLMSRTGPFEHCSVRDGHTDRLKPLPSAPAPTDSATAAALAASTEGHL
ncbi:DUF4913 domain-containing protein [Rhodococcoides corynebacterioides]|uniref:DUF4913 domain-containing protein n=1 Tax=Rhodococcoides corynebacterioides TaxID=53972 RepID=UPI003AEDC9A8